jgi:hypothetical protein
MMTRLARDRAREVFTARGLDDPSPEEAERARRAGYEPSGEYLVGRDPREMTRAELGAMGHEPMSPMEAIRSHCLDCCAGSAHEVRCCVAMACPSWPFRTGKNPWRSPISEERREALRERGSRLSEQRKINTPSAETTSSATTPHAEPSEAKNADLRTPARSGPRLVRRA